MQLSKEQENWIYNFINKELRFIPECGPRYYFLPFSIYRPFAVYDISAITDEQLELLHELAPQAIQNCLKPGYMIYAVDWNHNTVLYDPLNPDTAQSTEPCFPFFTNSGLAYFNSFYPNGDYYFFIDRFGAFGYLSHPWREEIWIFGEQLLTEFEKIENQLNFKKIASIK